MSGDAGARPARGQADGGVKGCGSGKMGEIRHRGPRDGGQGTPRPALTADDVRVESSGAARFRRYDEILPHPPCGGRVRCAYPPGGCVKIWNCRGCGERLTPSARAPGVGPRRVPLARRQGAGRASESLGGVFGRIPLEADNIWSLISWPVYVKRSYSDISHCVRCPQRFEIRQKFAPSPRVSGRVLPSIFLRLCQKTVVYRRLS